jgi:hypothetical protein
MIRTLPSVGDGVPAVKVGRVIILLVVKELVEITKKSVLSKVTAASEVITLTLPCKPPLNVSVELGVEVPMPTFPLDNIRILSVPPVTRPMLLVAGKYIPLSTSPLNR